MSLIGGMSAVAAKRVAGRIWSWAWPPLLIAGAMFYTARYYESRGAKRAEQACAIDMLEHLSDDFQAAHDAGEYARKVEADAAAKIVAALAQSKQELAHAQAALSDARARLRRADPGVRDALRPAACNDVPGAAAAPSDDDRIAGLRRSDVDFLFREAGRADTAAVALNECNAVLDAIYARDANVTP